MLNRQIEYFLQKPSNGSFRYLFIYMTIFKSNFLAVHFRIMVFCKLFSALNMESNDISYVRIWKIHFYLYSHILHWGLGLNFKQTWVALVWHSFFLKKTCFCGNIQEVLRFLKNLSNKPILW